MKKLLAAALVLAAVVAMPSRADDSGVTLGLRAGFGLPMGNLAGSQGGIAATSLSDTVNSKIPLWVDAGYRFNKNIFAGAYFQYGFAQINNDKTGCNLAGVSCSAHNLRFGIEGIYNFMPDAVFAPWAGIGIGYETASASSTVAGTTTDATFKGLEFLNLQFGGDYRVSPIFSVGPYAAFSVASYSSASVNGQDVTNYPSGTHEWLQFGIKGTFNL